MSDLNTVAVSGRLVADPEVVPPKVEGGRGFVTFSLAIAGIPDKNGKETVSFVDCKAFKHNAAYLASKAYDGRGGLKGDFIVMSAYIQQDRWEKDGQKRSKVVLIARDVSIASKRREDQVAASDEPFDSDDIPF